MIVIEVRNAELMETMVKEAKRLDIFFDVAEVALGVLVHRCDAGEPAGSRNGSGPEPPALTAILNPHEGKRQGAPLALSLRMQSHQPPPGGPRSGTPAAVRR